MEKIRGTNLGNWLVLEKWMKPDLFESTHTEDETWLSRKMPADEFAALIRQHRDTYVTEEDFRFIAENGLNTVRLPVPYFTFGDRPPFVGCGETAVSYMAAAAAIACAMGIDTEKIIDGLAEYNPE